MKNEGNLQILYITFIDFDNIKSGSGVRPKEMYKAFKQLGIDIKLLEGQQNKRKKRKRKVEEILDWLEDSKPDLCYVEPPTGPFFNSIDLKLLKKVHKKGIPMGIFYRDTFWRFPKSWGIPLWKKKILTFMHKRDLRVFINICDIIYFPGTKGREVLGGFELKKTGLLPPGGAEKTFAEDTFSERNCIYIGGTNEAYGGINLIRAFEHLNKDKIIATLTLISPETADFSKNKYKFPWLNIKHTFDRQEIEECYRKATFAVIPFKKTPYMEIAIPIKLFEYIGYGLPVISTDCGEIAKVLREYDCGILCGDSYSEIAEAVSQATSDYDEYLRLKKNALKARKENRWVDRAQQVINDLKGEKK